MTTDTPNPTTDTSPQQPDAGQDPLAGLKAVFEQAAQQNKLAQQQPPTPSQH